VRASSSRGRLHPEEECNIRTCFQRDVDRITHCKAFRRLKHKTQVFLQPEGDHYRTRLTHTLEVARLSRTVARALGLNEDLTEAIALGHDLGHTPFGHAGERALNRITPGGFRHYEQSLRVGDRLERSGQGLNLTWEVRDGIVNHQMNTIPATLEGRVVRLCDKIAYIHHDMDDAQRAGIISEDDIPITLRMTLGGSSAERLDTLVMDMIRSSEGKPDICQSEEVHDAMILLRRLMFADVYTNPTAKREEIKVTRMLGEMYRYYMENQQLLKGEYRKLLDQGEPPEKVVCDYISGMTDQYCINRFQEIYVPKPWDVM
jgi:dGTPase